ncbi:hypothetical protein FIV42_20910 [Persicimonas caeni]|uniref:Uncharacterized protein n=1 Tax=Persicimonas caeni TaxID=2292766 RepID=A0A4Y6PXP8_PERCE|nr:hypothetical protein FIV42_20910 [Persicimonas caeni]QED34334.1 hypothetical protein FRD00_20905 [Persicimonas caeni]
MRDESYASVQTVSDQQPKASVKVAANAIEDTARAVTALLDELDAEHAKLTMVFYGGDHDDKVIARALDSTTGARGVAGTTAGELSCKGFSHNSMTGMSFHGDGVRAAVEIVPKLRQLSLVPIVHLPGKLARGIGRSKSELDPERHLWLFMVDGHSGKEGLLTPFFMQAAPRLGLVGASLGDGEDFRHARVAHHGRVYRDAAAAILLEYDSPFETFKHTHMELTDRHVEVTKVSGGGRILEQLDGKLAQVVYAEALGIDPSQVTAATVAKFPLGYRFRGRPFPVSVLRIRNDGTFRLASSVQHGEQLSILEPNDLVGSTHRAIDEAIDALTARGCKAEALLLFHCIARYIEARHEGKVDALADALCQGPTCGLNTYGEQFETLHMNHSLTGVIFG